MVWGLGFLALEFKVQGSGFRRFGLDRIRHLLLTVEVWVLGNGGEKGQGGQRGGWPGGAGQGGKGVERGWGGRAC